MASVWPDGGTAHKWPRPSADGQRELRAVVTATENDLHALGPRFVADFLQGEGWTTLDLGVSTPTTEIVGFVEQSGPDLVCLSTTLPAHLPGARRAVSQLRELPRPPLIAVGGQAYGDDETVAAAMGADLFASDAAAFLNALPRRMGQPAR
jgi:methanogenic corrinoid protein MtbC1